MGMFLVGLVLGAILGLFLGILFFISGGDD